MENVRSPAQVTGGWVRPLSIIVVIAFAALLALCLWQWARGQGHLDHVFSSLAFLLLTSPHAFRIEGVTRLVLQFLGLGIAILAGVMLLRSLGY